MNICTLMGTKEVNNGFFGILRIPETIIQNPGNLKGRNLMVMHGVTNPLESFGFRKPESRKPQGQKLDGNAWCHQGPVTKFNKKKPRKPDVGWAKVVVRRRVPQDEK